MCGTFTALNAQSFCLLSANVVDLHHIRVDVLHYRGLLIEQFLSVDGDHCR